MIETTLPQNPTQNYIFGQPFATKKYIITGGPGCGKTTTLDILAKDYTIIPEAARQIFSHPFSKYLTPREIQYSIMRQQIQNESLVQDPIALLDRSLVDGIGYSKLFDTTLPDDYMDRVREANYQPLVFFLEPLPRTYYKQDDIRRESYEECLNISNVLHDTYLENGFQLKLIPPKSPQQRVSQILTHIRVGAQ